VICRLDVAEKTGASYENGKTRPPLALVKLLKVLDRHPDLLDEIKVA
jgi:DNA-binding transcriptional regulator YiaG